MTPQFLASSFVKVITGCLTGSRSGFRRKALMAGFKEEWGEYVETKAYEEAAFQAEMGHHIPEKRVYEILHSPDKHYCGFLTPYNFADSFDNAQIAIVAMRETIREELGVSIGRATIKELQTRKSERLIP